MKKAVAARMQIIPMPRSHASKSDHIESFSVAEHGPDTVRTSEATPFPLRRAVQAFPRTRPVGTLVARFFAAVRALLTTAPNEGLWHDKRSRETSEADKPANCLHPIRSFVRDGPCGFRVSVVAQNRAQGAL
jgi:hypothetical protein